MLVSSNSFANEINIISFDILDNHDVFFGQEMESKLVNGVSQDRFLDKENIATSLDNLFNDSDDIFSLFLKDSIHSSVVADNNVVF